jgi:uncharacterized protein YidB (DUF937 family)
VEDEMNPKDLLGAAAGAARQQGNEGDGIELPGVAGGDPAQAAAVMGKMMEQLQSKDGLGGLLDMLGSSGLASQLGGAPAGDTSLSGAQQVLGMPILNVIASKLGLSPEQARSVLAQLVPKIEQRMADDEARTGQPNAELSRSLTMLKQIL